jgi:hypothetical protein
MTRCHYCYPSAPKPTHTRFCVDYIVHLRRRTTKAIENIWHTAHDEALHLLADRRRRTMCKRAEAYDIASTPSKMQKITEQNGLESHLLRLPVELRLQIYDYIYSPSAIFTIREKLVHGRYALVSVDMTRAVSRRCLCDLCKACVQFPFKDALALPLTCRQIYTETIPYVHGRSKFCFGDTRLNLSLPHVIPAKHLQCITSLRLLFYVDRLIDLFDVSQTPFSKEPKFVNDPNLAVTWRRKKYVRLWPYLAMTLVNIRGLTVIFRRFEIPDNDIAREQRFCDWLLTPLLQSRDGESLWSHRLARFEVRLGYRWNSLVDSYAKPLTINGGSQVAPFELKRDCDCMLDRWACQCPEIEHEFMMRY